MAVRVFIPTPLRSFTDDQASVELEGGSVREVLSELVQQHASLRQHLYDDQGRIRKFVNIYVNNEDIRYLQREETLLKSGDNVHIVPAIAGGNHFPTQAPLAAEEIQRYSRHLIMPEVGMEGQLKLRDASVLCIGAGGLGSPLGLYLAAAGVGRLGLVDFDVVDFSNLQRQILHSTADVGRSKLDSAAERIAGINPSVQIEKHELCLNSQNALELIGNYDLVVDGTDNFPTRYLVNDACVLTGKPNVYGSIFRFEGQASIFAHQNGPCYRCLYPEPPPAGLVPSCAEGGVLGVLPGIVGTIQATEAIKLILGVGDPLIGRLLLFDALAMHFRHVKVRRDPHCLVCGDHPSILEPIDYETFCGIDATASPDGIDEITVSQLKREFDQGRDILLLDVRNPPEIEICRIPGSMVIPLNELVARASELDSARDIVVHCKTGGRSAQAIGELQQLGFRKLRNLKGGILAWAEKIDSSLPTY